MGEVLALAGLALSQTFNPIEILTLTLTPTPILTLTRVGSRWW